VRIKSKNNISTKLAPHPAFHLYFTTLSLSYQRDVKAPIMDPVTVDAAAS
jgi:hypothetical protein